MRGSVDKPVTHSSPVSRPFLSAYESWDAWGKSQSEQETKWGSLTLDNLEEHITVMRV